jgi:DNA-binding PadR family transcriptional regulator
MATIRNLPFLSEVEQLILLAVLKVEGEAYAVPIRRLVRTETGIDLPRGTVYVTLDRLEQNGMVASWESKPLAIPGGKKRRLFRLLPAGMAALRASTRATQRMLEGTTLAKG